MNVRVRFAPSPTGGLHLGGIRTVLYNYLFAKKHGGSFIVRIEDTDQSRYVAGAEEYIFKCLQWCGIKPDESVEHGGNYGPYRQSERKEIYKKYAEQLIESGHAYYAFDSPEEIEAMRERLKAEGKDGLQYDHHSRMQMKNSLSLSPEQTKELIEKGTPYVVRIKVNPAEEIRFTDMIRGEIDFNTNVVDDKVLVKADGMPTYHLAVVVDDHLMRITHAFRGEEWLPSAPIHILLWKYLFGLENMPQWAHLPLILKPDGNGKLSKRDGDRLGFPVYALNWTDATGHTTKGFKEEGFLPEAFMNLLAVLGWNDGTEQEIYTIEEMIQAFSMDHIHKGGAKFDYEKAKWFNHEWIKKSTAEELFPDVLNGLSQAGFNISNTSLEGNNLPENKEERLLKIIDLVKDRCTLLTDFTEQAGFFFKAPENTDTTSISAKWNEDKKAFFEIFIEKIKVISNWNATNIETSFKELALEKNIKPGELQLPLRIMLVGAKFGPGVFEIANLLGAQETASRIEKTLSLLHK